MRSTDPRCHTPQFQEYQEYCATKALGDMRLQSKTKTIPQPAFIWNDYLTETLSDRLRYTHPHPPTPPRPSQKRLEEEGEAQWDGSQVDDGEFEEGAVDDSAKGADSPRSNRLYTQEELVTLTRKIFGDENEEDDEAFWDDTDGSLWTANDHPARDEGAGVDHQDQENDTRGQSGEKANKGSKLDGLFGPTSDVCPLTPSKDGLPHSHQDKDDDQNVEIVQGVSEAAPGSAIVDTSDGVNSSTDNTPPTATPSTLPTSPESSCTVLRPSAPTQHPPPPESGFGTLSTIEDALVGNLQPGESPEAHTGANDDLSDPVSVPTTQVDPSEAEELEPRKPAVVIPSEEEPHCNKIRHIIRKRRLPEFSPTRPGIFSAITINSSDDAPLGKRKRSREDDGDECERAFSPSPIPQSDHQLPRPR